jgi:hypothetical protein
MRLKLKADRCFANGGLKDSVLCRIEVWDTSLDTSFGPIASKNILVRVIDSGNYCQSPSVEFSTTTGAPLDFRVYWPGHVGVYIDYVAIDNRHADSIAMRVPNDSTKYFFEDTFYNYLANYNNWPTGSWLFGLKILDEVYQDSLYPVLGMVQEMATSPRFSNHGVVGTLCYSSGP